MSSCSTGKTCYEDQYEAEQALIENWIRYHHRPGAGPQNVYQCQDCGLYHFTSRGPMSEVLEENMNHILSQRRVRDWESKFR